MRLQGTGSKLLFLVQSTCDYKANSVIISANILCSGLCSSEVLHASHSKLKSITQTWVLSWYQDVIIKKLITAFEVELEYSRKR